MKKFPKLQSLFLPQSLKVIKVMRQILGGREESQSIVG